MLPLLPVVIGLGGLAIYRAGRPNLYGVLTEERKALYIQALQKSDPPLTPEQLVQLAAVYEQQGLNKLGDILRARANLRSLSPEEKAHRAEIYKTLLSIKDPAKAYIIRQGAAAFDSDSAFSQADTLNDYATALEAQANMAILAEVTAPPLASTAPAQPPTAPTDAAPTGDIPVDSSYDVVPNGDA